MFNLRSVSGQVVYCQGLYKDKSGALEGIESIRNNSVREGAFEARANAKGQPYFILKETDGQEIGRKRFLFIRISHGGYCRIGEKERPGCRN